jgi:hypothetical protein
MFKSFGWLRFGKTDARGRQPAKLTVHPPGGTRRVKKADGMLVFLENWLTFASHNFYLIKSGIHEQLRIDGDFYPCSE